MTTIERRNITVKNIDAPKVKCVGRSISLKWWVAVTCPASETCYYVDNNSESLTTQNINDSSGPLATALKVYDDAESKTTRGPIGWMSWESDISRHPGGVVHSNGFMWFDQSHGEVTSHSAPQLLLERAEAKGLLAQTPSVGPASRQHSQHFVHVKLTTKEAVATMLGIVMGALTHAVATLGIHGEVALEETYAALGLLETRTRKQDTKIQHVHFDDGNLPSMVVSSANSRASDIYKFVGENIVEGAMIIADYCRSQSRPPRANKKIVIASSCVVGNNLWSVAIRNHAKMLVATDRGCHVAGLGDLIYAYGRQLFWPTL